MNHIFYLDWDSQKLFGWENRKSDLVIDAIIRSIEAGDDFPAVPVHQDQEDYSKFYISPLRECSARFLNGEHLSDGGHHRAVGHYIAGKPLKCELDSGGPVVPESICVEIPDILIVDDKGEYQSNKKNFPNYR